jgi:hypothetical protein
MIEQEEVWIFQASFFLFTGEGFWLGNHQCLPKCQLFWEIWRVNLGIWQKVSIFTPNLCANNGSRDYR